MIEQPEQNVVLGDFTERLNKIGIEYRLVGSMKKTPQERARFASAMFVAGRKAVIASLHKDLSENEIKNLLYYRTHGEHLPEDFFKN